MVQIGAQQLQRSPGGLRILEINEESSYTMDSAAYARLLRKHGQARDVPQGRALHEKLAQVGADRDCTFLGNNLIQMYGDCGCVEDARAVFDRLLERNVYTWTIMTAAYTQNGHDAQAVVLFRYMDCEGVKPNSVTFINVLTACSSLRDLHTGTELHERIASQGLEADNVLGTALLTMYSNCERLQEAKLVFDGLVERDVVAWTAIITAYGQLGKPKVALRLFKEMELDGVKPNQSTFVNVLAACMFSEAGKDGDLLYRRAVAAGLRTDVYVGSTAITMYSRCGRLAEAKAAFENLQENKSTTSWNSMIRAYVQHGRFQEALQLYKEMEAQGAKADSFTLVCLLGACKDLKEAESIAKLATGDEGECDDVVAPMVVSVYAKCGGFEQAMVAFTKMSSRNVVPWNALMAGYVQAELGKEALEIYHRMNLEGFTPDIYTYSTVLGACSCSRSLAHGKGVHARIVSSGLQAVVPLQNGLVNMYAKCGSLQTARELFTAMKARNSVSWNTMVTALCQNGEMHQALEMFKKLVLEGAEPHEHMFTSVLHLCSHSGRLDDACDWFRTMVESFCIVPMEEHFRCMIDLLGRSGHVLAAERVVEHAFPENVIAWTSLLSACRMHKNAQVGARATEQLMRLGASSAPLVQLSNLYSDARKSFV